MKLKRVEAWSGGGMPPSRVCDCVFLGFIRDLPRRIHFPRSSFAQYQDLDIPFGGMSQIAQIARTRQLGDNLAGEN